ncbi:unnamed protein product, partial [Urochloa humidicola]
VRSALDHGLPLSYGPEQEQDSQQEPFDQVDREKNWDDQVVLTALVFYALHAALPIAGGLPCGIPGGLAWCPLPRPRGPGRVPVLLVPPGAAPPLPLLPLPLPPPQL